MSQPEKTKLIYVLSAAYSGSTLMGLALGDHPQIINLGEVVNLESDYAEAAKCTCQQRLKDCSFWDAIKRSIDRSTEELLEQGISSQSSFNLSRSGERERLDRRGGLQKIRLLLGSSMISTYSDAYLNRYRSKNECFFSSVVNTFPNTEYLVDLSKSAERLEALLASEQLDIWCIYLRRDPLKVYASTLKRPKRTRKFLGPKALREAMWLRARTRDMDKVFSQMPEARKLEINFVDFTAHPQTVLDIIFEKIGLVPMSKRKTDSFLITPSQQHVYVGNRWLFNPQLSTVLVKERSDAANLSWIHQLIFRLVWWKQSLKAGTL